MQQFKPNETTDRSKANIMTEFIDTSFSFAIFSINIHAFSGKKKENKRRLRHDAENLYFNFMVIININAFIVLFSRNDLPFHAIAIDFFKASPMPSAVCFSTQSNWSFVLIHT